MHSESANFETIEELCQFIDGMGWDSDVLQLDRSAGISTFRGQMTPDLILSLFHFSNKIHQRAMPIPGYHTFGMLAGPQAPTSYSGQILDQDSLSLMNQGNGLDAFSEAGFTGLTIALRDELLHSLAEQHELAAPGSDNWGWQQGPLVSDPAMLAAIRRQVLRCFQGTCELDEDELEIDLALRVLTLGSQGRAAAPSRFPSRARARRRALGYLRAHRRERVTVQELCEVAACSVSTLERAFLDEFGVTPKRYIQRERLSGVRRAMLEDPPERTITDIASDWNFSHMSKFAADYRRAFGELPSETRKEVS